ncbi:hypothetical protein GE118_00320 [Mycoplasma sp. NEAQ87857]|uniref:hypothetical protein n=1 Tax=Mycoplasma sp. NEAQ87857 TaxID=2683967 RepID=UPI0013190FCC|nr:hypothetical protein [Mycoplasma sp. NEAQ87857]QGZ97248.1 hypothetical protein GE118_00320 [Mycoplasma sp. NEAQ87857]
MINIKTNSINFNNQFQDIICIDTSDCNLFLKQIYNYEFYTQEPSIEINNQNYSINELFIINDLTMVNTLYSFNSKNILMSLINSNNSWEQSKILNLNTLEQIKNDINQTIGKELLSINSNLSKMMKVIFELEEHQFINKDILIKWLTLNKNKNKQTIIFNNYSNIKISDLVPFIHSYNFIILTNDFRMHCSNFDELELVSFVNKNNIVTIQSKDSIINWMENYFKEKINDSDFEKYFKIDDVDSKIMTFLLKKEIFS